MELRADISKKLKYPYEFFLTEKDLHVAVSIYEPEHYTVFSSLSMTA